jgi:hypothetical protein
LCKKVKKGERWSCAFLGTSQEGGDEPRRRRKRNNKQSNIRSKPKPKAI